MKIFHILSLTILLAVALTLNGCSSSSTGSSDEDLTPPPVPSGLTLTDIDNGSATLSWQAVSDKGLKGYYVYWLGGSEADIVNANRMFVTGTTTTISSLDYETIYYFAVSSVDKSENESGLSVQESGKPLNTKSPQPPVGLDVVAENIDYPKITIFWAQNGESDLAHYKLYRATSPAGLEDESAFVATLTSESYTDIDVEVGSAYYYRLTAIDKGGWESAYSTVVSDYVLPKVELTAPLQFAYTGNTPSFSWKPVTGAVKYNIVLTTSRIGGEIWNIEVDENTRTIVYNGKTKLISGNTYWWKIGAISRKEINSISDAGAFVVQSQ